jgi:hypothetical protein
VEERKFVRRQPRRNGRVPLKENIVELIDIIPRDRLVTALPSAMETSFWITPEIGTSYYSTAIAIKVTRGKPGWINLLTYPSSTEEKSGYTYRRKMWN